MLRRLGDTIYRLLLLAYPRQFRREYGADMAQLFRDRRAEARHRPLQVARLWLLAIHDVLVQAAAERAAPFVKQPRHSSPVHSSSKGVLMETIVQDLRYALRSLRKQPGFSFVVVLTLALGIGATTAIFSVVNGVLFRKLPYDAQERIVRFWATSHGVPTGAGPIPYLNFVDVWDRSTVFETAAAYDEWRPSLTGLDEPEQIDGAQVTSGFFDVLGVRPHLGRFFIRSEDFDGNDAVVVLSYQLWQRKFGSDPGVIGTSVLLNGRPHVVVGVGPRDFEDPVLSGSRWGIPQIWRPLGYDGLSIDDQPSRGSSSYTAIGRLKPGTTLEQAAAQMAAISAQLEAEYPEENTGDGMIPIPIHETIVGDIRTSLLILMGAVGLVLAIAATNVGNLILSRGLDRGREIALRTALGATRSRIARQLLTESLVLAVVGGLIGVLISLGITDMVTTLGANGIPRASEIVLDLRVLGFAAAVTLLTGIVSGFAPIFQVRGYDLRSSLGSGGKSITDHGAPLRLRSALIVSEMALAFLLLIGAGLFLKSFWNLTRVDTGLETANLLTFELAPPSAKYPSEQVNLFYVELLDRLQSVPGAQQVATVNIAPLSGGFDCNGIRADDRPPPPPGEGACAEVRTITPDYFDVMGIELMRGRIFMAADNADAVPVMIINEALAAEMWPNENALGKRIRFFNDVPTDVVGVVKNVSHLSLDEPPPLQAYVPRAQGTIPWQLRRSTVVVRTGNDPLSLVPTIRRAVWEIDGDLPLANVNTMEQFVSQSVAAPRLRTVLLGSFAALAIVLASVGIYGVISYSVSQRTREMAIRLALGAERGKLLAFVIGRGIRPVVIGMLIGLGAALATTRVLEGLLFQVTATDPAAFVAVPLLLLAVAIVASYVPARRAAAVDPMGTLREE